MLILEMATLILNKSVSTLIHFEHSSLDSCEGNMLRRAGKSESHKRRGQEEEEEGETTARSGRRQEEEEGETTASPWLPMTGAERTRRHRKRKKEREGEARNVVEPTSTALTAAERMRIYRKRKKVKQQVTERDIVHYDQPATVNLEPMPGGSKDPVRFYPHPDPVQLIPSPRRAISPVDSVTLHGK